jgi:hypothetical protein
MRNQIFTTICIFNYDYIFYYLNEVIAFDIHEIEILKQKTTKTKQIESFFFLLLASVSPRF